MTYLLFFFFLLRKFREKADGLYATYLKSKFGFLGKDVVFKEPNEVMNPHNIYMYDNTKILGRFTFLSVTGKFIMKKNSGSAQGLTIITGNHHRAVGNWFKDINKLRLLDEEKDVIVEEDVWIGANVTIVAGVTIGRGATIGAGCVCFRNVPPYAIVIGNPAKIVGFNYTPQEVVEHESALYPEEDRIPLEKLESNYDKYFLKRAKEIKHLF